MERINRNVGKIIFLIIIVVALSICGYHYIRTSSHFESSCDKICERYDNLCQQLPELMNISHTDSIVTIKTESLIIIQSGHIQIKDMLELQHGEIQEDFSSLMLWASVLMVIFLIFSIYSMYRVDDLVSQCRNSASTVTDLSTKAEQKLVEVDNLFQSESLKLRKQTETEIEKLKSTETERIDALEKDIEQKTKKYEARITDELKNFNKAIDKKSAEVQKQFETILSSTGPLAKLAEALRPANDSNKDTEK